MAIAESSPQEAGKSKQEELAEFSKLVNGEVPLSEEVRENLKQVDINGKELSDTESFGKLFLSGKPNRDQIKEAGEYIVNFLTADEQGVSLIRTAKAMYKHAKDVNDPKDFAALELVGIELWDSSSDLQSRRYAELMIGSAEILEAKFLREQGKTIPALTRRELYDKFKDYSENENYPKEFRNSAKAAAFNLISKEKRADFKKVETESGEIKYRYVPGSSEKEKKAEDDFLLKPNENATEQESKEVADESTVDEEYLEMEDDIGEDEINARGEGLTEDQVQPVPESRRKWRGAELPPKDKETKPEPILQESGEIEKKEPSSREKAAIKQIDRTLADPDLELETRQDLERAREKMGQEVDVEEEAEGNKRKPDSIESINVEANGGKLISNFADLEIERENAGHNQLFSIREVKVVYDLVSDMEKLKPVKEETELNSKSRALQVSWIVASQIIGSGGFKEKSINDDTLSLAKLIKNLQSAKTLQKELFPDSESQQLDQLAKDLAKRRGKNEKSYSDVLERAVQFLQRKRRSLLEYTGGK